MNLVNGLAYHKSSVRDIRGRTHRKRDTTHAEITGIAWGKTMDRQTQGELTLNAGKAGGSLPGTQGKSAGLRRIAERRGTAQYIVRGQFRPK